MLTPIHARMARAALGWSLAELKERIGLSKTTLIRFEAGQGVQYATALKLEEAFAREGITFVDEDKTHGAGILLSKELSNRLGSQKKRVTKSVPKSRTQKR
jgi:transcriptional regulator with XRE-family HTH domain